MKYIEANLSTLAGGKAILMFNHELGEAIKSCCDKNKEVNRKRTITLKVILLPDAERQEIGVTCTAESNLPGDKPCVEHILVSQTGNAYVNNSQQLQLEEMEQLGEIEHIDQETGEVTKR